MKTVCTGLCDSNGRLIKIGDRLKKPVECNEELHGQWAVYEVVQQGLTPIISYRYSETGEVIPAGYLAAPLCDEYERKNFCFAKNVSQLRPIAELVVVEASSEH